MSGGSQQHYSGAVCGLGRPYLPVKIAMFRYVLLCGSVASWKNRYVSLCGGVASWKNRYVSLCSGVWAPCFAMWQRGFLEESLCFGMWERSFLEESLCFQEAGGLLPGRIAMFRYVKA